MLKKQQLNLLLDLIKAANLDPRKFRRGTVKIDGFIGNVQVGTAHQLQLADSSVVFIIATNFRDEKWRYSLLPRECEITSSGPKGKRGTWSDWTADFQMVEKSFSGWLDDAAKKYFAYVAEQEEEQNTPDLWAELDAAATDVEALDNTPFSSDDRQRIATALDHFLKEVHTREIVSTDDFKLLKERVEYSIESSKRLRRKDWVMATTGALMSFAVQVGLTSNVATELLQLAADALKWIWIARPQLLGP